MIKRYAIPPSESLAPSVRIVDQTEECLIVSELPDDIDEFEALIEIEQPTATPLFPDYGFTSPSGRYYLFAPLVTAFAIVAGDPVESEMLCLQLEEYIIARTDAESSVYWIGKQHEELLWKVASVYGVTICIFDLDKCGKND